MIKLEQKKSGLISYMDLKKPSVKLVYWIIFSVLLIVSAVCLLPPLWIMVSSLKDIKEFLAIPPSILPRSFHPEKLIETWKMLKFIIPYFNTVKVAAGTLAFSIIFNGLTAYVISRLKPIGSKVVLTLILWTMMIPTTTAMIPLFKTFIDFPILHVNLTDSFLPLWLMGGANAFLVLLFKGFFDGIPQSLIEASRLDGCDALGIFFKVVLPLSKPVIMVSIILIINAVWSDFFWPYLVLRDRGMQTVMIRIFEMRRTGYFSIDYQMIGLTFAILPPAILFMIFQKYIIQGVTMSGIKG